MANFKNMPYLKAGSGVGLSVPTCGTGLLSLAHTVLRGSQFGFLVLKNDPSSAESSLLPKIFSNKNVIFAAKNVNFDRFI
jgi:hypothetical protein